MPWRYLRRQHALSLEVADLCRHLKAHDAAMPAMSVSLCKHSTLCKSATARATCNRLVFKVDPYVRMDANVASV